METVEKTYKIPKHNFGYLQEKITKLNKRAKKLGLDSIKMEIVREYEITIDKDYYGGRQITPYNISMVDVKVEGESPKFEGWTFIATIEHEKAASNLIKAIPGVELDPKYRDAPPDCDHCHTNRWRKKTYVCKHDDGSEVQVGSTCVKDFLGHRSPDSIAWQCETLGNIQEAFSEMEDYEVDKMPKSELRVPIKRFMEVTAMVIREEGWIPKSKVPYDAPVSTATMVDMYLFPPPDRRPPKIEITHNDARLAYGALQWAKNLKVKSNLSDYEYNLTVLADERSIPLSEFGLAVSMVGVYKMYRDKTKQERAAYRSNEYFGEVKKRYELDLKVLSISGFDSVWGWVTVYKMVDPEGNAFGWFSTGSTSLEEGETYHVKATVKKHQEWKGRKETVVTRLTILE